MVSIENLTKYFPIRGGVWKTEKGRLQVLNGISLTICAHETLAIVGESGCGKSTLAKLMVNLEKPSSGRIVFNGQPVHCRRKGLKAFYRSVQMVFQDPFSSLNPRLKINTILSEMPRVHGASRKKAIEMAREIIVEVGLSIDDLNKYPHEFSGGQRQRIAIARALILKPALLIADEPVSALDLAVRAQIIDLLETMKSRYALTIVFISHDLNLVSRISDRIAVMYLGRIVETVPAKRLFTDGRHPYLKMLLRSLPPATPARRKNTPPPVTGEVPGPDALPRGCGFHPRCPDCADICRHEIPELTPQPAEGHFIACHFPAATRDHIGR